MLKRGFTGGYVSLGDSVIHYIQRDSRENCSAEKVNRTILMLHQGGSSGREFINVASILNGWHVLMPDIPGHGNSSEYKNAEIIDYATQIAKFIKLMDIEKLTIFGHHFGGVVAAEVAVLLGNTVEHLILSNTPYVDEHARKLRVGEQPRSYVKTAKDGSHLQQLWKSKIQMFNGDPFLANRYIAENLLLGPDVEQAHLAVANYKMETRFNEYSGKLTYIHAVADPYIAIEIDHALEHFQPDKTVTIEQGTVAVVDQLPEEIVKVIEGSTK